MSWMDNKGQEFWENLTPENMYEYLSDANEMNATDENGDTPLHLACRWNQNPEVIQLMLDGAAGMCVGNKSLALPIHSAALHSNNPIIAISVLRANKCPLDPQDINGYTPLHFLAMRSVVDKDGLYQSVQLLLRSGQILFHKMDKHGHTSLVYAERNILFNYKRKATWFSRGEHPLLKEWRLQTPTH